MAGSAAAARGFLLWRGLRRWILARIRTLGNRPWIRAFFHRARRLAGFPPRRESKCGERGGKKVPRSHGTARKPEELPGKNHRKYSQTPGGGSRHRKGSTNRPAENVVRGRGEL